MPAQPMKRKHTIVVTFTTMQRCTSHQARRLFECLAEEDSPGFKEGVSGFAAGHFLTINKIHRPKLLSNFLRGHGIFLFPKGAKK